jgi:hypothetical protein
LELFVFLFAANRTDVHNVLGVQRIVKRLKRCKTTCVETGRNVNGKGNQKDVHVSETSFPTYTWAQLVNVIGLAPIFVVALLASDARDIFFAEESRRAVRKFKDRLQDFVFDSFSRQIGHSWNSRSIA